MVADCWDVLDLIALNICFGWLERSSFKEEDIQDILWVMAGCCEVDGDSNKEDGGRLEKTNLPRTVVQKWPGLAQEVAKICLAIEIPDVNQNNLNKKDINIALRKHDRGEITEKFGEYKKLDKIVANDPTQARD